MTFDDHHTINNKENKAEETTQEVSLTTVKEASLLA
jgi:hypothetical protein